MQAVQVTQFGPPEVLKPVESPDPVAGAGEAVIGVVAADILYVETQVRRGWGRDFFPLEPPYVPGDGVVGEVLSAGESADAGWVGRRVAAHTGGHDGYAARAVVPAGALIPVPDGLDPVDAVALLNDGPTALTLFEAARIKPADRVLILAAAGGMGVLLVQLAHAAGARVIGAARGERKQALVRERGADVVVDYSEPDWPDRVREATDGAGVDVVFDGVGGEIGAAAFALTARDGRFSAHGAPSGGFAEIDLAEAERRGVTVRGIQHVQLTDEDKRALAAHALSEAAAGRLKPLVGQTFPLERAADAHAAIEAREVVGKTVLVV